MTTGCQFDWFAMFIPLIQTIPATLGFWGSWKPQNYFKEGSDSFIPKTENTALGSSPTSWHISSLQHKSCTAASVSNMTAKLKRMGLYIANKAPQATQKPALSTSAITANHRWANKNLPKWNIKRGFNLHRSTTEPNPFPGAEGGRCRAALSSRRGTARDVLCRGSGSFPNGCTESSFSRSFSRGQLLTPPLPAKEVKV